jgi:HEAT repeat protein
MPMVERIYVSDRNAPLDEDPDEYLIADLIANLFIEDHKTYLWSAYLLASRFTPPLPERIPDLSEALKLHLQREDAEPSVVLHITKCLVRSLEVSPNQEALGALIQALSSFAAPLAALGISYIPDKSAVEPLIDSIKNSHWEEFWIEEDLKVYRNKRKLEGENPYAAVLELTIHEDYNFTTMSLTSTVIKTLGIIGDSRAIDILTKFSNHEYEEISGEAKKAIEKIIKLSK